MAKIKYEASLTSTQRASVNWSVEVTEKDTDETITQAVKNAEKIFEITKQKMLTEYGFLNKEIRG